MKRLLCAMATIALLVSPVATAQPDKHRGQQHEQSARDNHQGNNRRAVNRQAVNRRMDQRRAAQRQAVNRGYNAGYANGSRINRGYADPRRYANNGYHRGWNRDRGNTYRWQRGQRMGYNDWYYAPRVSYSRHHLRRPPYGYQWRQYDDRYVLVSVATGLIASVILFNGG
jgi:Ni/Co efflux regulator RcnB